MKTLKVDYENTADKWWDNAVELVHTCVTGSSGCPVSALPLLTSNADEISVSDVDADNFVKWANLIEGWSDGPSYAENPIIISEVTK